MMKNALILLVLLFVMACSSPQETQSTQTTQEYKVPVYGWLGGPGEATDQQLRDNFSDLKSKGIDGLMYNGGQNPATYRRVGKIAKEVGLAFHTWIPTMVQSGNDQLKPEYYAINGKGESAFDKPAYVDYYKFLCPSREEVYAFLAEMYGAVAEVPEVDAIHPHRPLD